MMINLSLFKDLLAKLTFNSCLLLVSFIALFLCSYAKDIVQSRGDRIYLVVVLWDFCVLLDQFDSLAKLNGFQNLKIVPVILQLFRSFFILT